MPHHLLLPWGWGWGVFVHYCIYPCLSFLGLYSLQSPHLLLNTLFIQLPPCFIQFYFVPQTSIRSEPPFSYFIKNFDSYYFHDFKGAQPHLQNMYKGIQKGVLNRGWTLNLRTTCTVVALNQLEFIFVSDVHVAFCTQKIYRFLITQIFTLW